MIMKRENEHQCGARAGTECLPCYVQGLDLIPSSTKTLPSPALAFLAPRLLHHQVWLASVEVQIQFNNLLGSTQSQ